MWQNLKCVDDFLNRAFHKLGLVVGRHPGYFVIVPLLLACICFTGYQRIHYEIDPEYLFSPINGPGKTERAVVEQYFKVNYSYQFDLSRITRPGRFGHVIVTPKDGGHNMLKKEIWQELIELDRIIKDIKADYEGETFTYEHICARWLSECFGNNILDLHHVIAEVERGDLNLTFPLMLNPVTLDALVFPVFFGGSVIDNGLIKSVPSVQLAYFITVDSPRQDAIGAAWEEAFLEVIGKVEDEGAFKHISTARFASRTLELELEANTKTVVPYFASTFIIMGLFSVVTCMMTDWVRSKPWLGLLGNISAAIATGAAFGLCMYLGIDFIGINLAAPFLMIGIGIDDTFVMLAAWRRTSISKPVPERMAATLSEAAVSITITSLTDMISFFIGIMSPFPSVKIFCIYSGFAVVFTFLFHITFFSGCVAISGYCERKNLHSVVCCKVEPLSKSTHRSWLYRVLCSGGIDPDDPHNPIDNPEHGCMTWFRDYLAVALNYRAVKAFIIVIFICYLLGALYGLTTLQEGLERRKLSKEDSYSIAFYDRQDIYFREFPYRIQVVVTGDYNYSDPVIQAQMENLTRSLESSKYISEPIYTESWLRNFLKYMSSQEDSLNVSIDNEHDFIEVLKDYWLYESSVYSLDVKLDDKREKIVASRFLIQAVNVSGTNQEKDMVKELRGICDESPLNASVFHPYFVFFDQFELVRPTSIQCMIFGALVMMFISFIFIPNILCCLWVAFCIVSIELGVGGYMALWDVNLDSISMINLIMCIGFSVDFTAHICYAYMSSKRARPEDRMKDSLYSLGLPIVQGAASTILGLVALLLAGTYIFLVFFKMVFLVIFIGAMHGIFLLPVLLSIFGPGTCISHSDEPDDTENANSAPEKEPTGKFQQPFVIPHPHLVYYTAGAVKPLQDSPATSMAAFEERDPGLGTSEDSNSTESGSSQSRRRQCKQQEQQEQPPPSQARHEMWRRSIGVLYGLSQFQPAATSQPPHPAPDYPGAVADNPRPSSGENGNTRLAPHLEPYVLYRQPSQLPRDYKRSRSYHNLQHPASTRYPTDPRYP
ncbi:patched domain-containing protein 3 [Harpegnathos saltator]|uniref:patched domain-containing protein 3 n=1 Tax=Harpegnathos saltator TaxID=610380 RepID=UPI00058D5F0C|nr:patched domain-containing protein 3 [Harpegnathos saltator]XP_025158167.1 patched domain-containing protein 3 [Harpegnathos saltator]